MLIIKPNKFRSILIASLFLFNCNPSTDTANKIDKNTPYIVVLGITQDGGYPQAGTKNSDAWKDISKRKYVSCLGIVDPASSERWLIDATPDFKEQLYLLDEIAPVPGKPGLSGILLTHAHIGHYTGLMNLGREVLGTKNVNVYAMPGMYDFLLTNAPWDLLVRLENIKLHKVSEKNPVQLNSRISVIPILVPHRAEYTETVGYKINGPNRSVLYIPDIDKWQILDEWGTKIENLIKEADLVFLDGTFYADGEVPGRSMAEIPHPFITESIQRFMSLPAEQKQKIRFIHLNHSNPVLIYDSDAQKHIKSEGYSLAEQLEQFGL